MNDALKIIVGILLGTVLVLLLIGSFFGGGMGMMIRGGMMGSGMLGTFFMLLFWVLIIALIVAFVFVIVSASRRR